MNLTILYEDSALLFVDKPANLIVQRAYDQEEPVLLEMAAAQCGQHLYLMQRLDRGTSGVIFFSKRADINAKLTRQFETKRIEKLYLALCEGELGEAQTIDAPLARIGPISFAVRDHGKCAITVITPDARDPASYPSDPTRFAQPLDRDLKGVRVACGGSSGRNSAKASPSSAKCRARWESVRGHSSVNYAPRAQRSPPC